MNKRIGIFLITLCMCFGLLHPEVTVWAASGKTSVSVSASSVNIGDTVTVTGKASGPSGEKVLATMTLSWDANILQFVSCSVDSNGGGGSRRMNGDSFTITLKAISAGTSAVSMSAEDGVLFDTVESLDAMQGSSASVTVNNAASTGGSSTPSGGSTGGSSTPSGGSTGGSSTPSGGNTGGSSTSSGGSTGGSTTVTGSTTTGTLSADNSLKSLTISPGTLSPSFVYNKTSYTATVGSDVSSIAVSAMPANEKAVVESVTGNDNLKEGANTVKIVVKAENGVTATYTIKVTKQAASGETTNPSKPEEEPEETQEQETQEQVTVNGISYQISTDFSAEEIPTDFSESKISYHGNPYKGVSYTKGSLNLLWLVSQDAVGKFFVYDETRDNLYPFVRFANGEKYVIALAAPVDFTMPENYLQTSFAVDEENTISAYQKMPEAESEIVPEFYVFYGVNHEGTENWYQYDALEGTYQRLSAALTESEDSVSSENMTYLQEEYAELSEKYTQEKAFARNTIAVLIFILAVLVIVIINLLIHRYRRQSTDELDTDEYEEEFISEETERAELLEHEPKARELPDEKLPDKKLPDEKADTSDDLDVIDFNDL